MKLLNALIATIGIEFDFRDSTNFRLFEKSEIMPLTIGKGSADYLLCLLINDYLGFKGVTLFLA
jgi:hypothetical protein